MINNTKIDIPYFMAINTFNNKKVQISLRYFTVFFTGFVIHSRWF